LSAYVLKTFHRTEVEESSFRHFRQVEHISGTWDRISGIRDRMPVMHGSLSKREERVAGTRKTVEGRGPKMTIKMAHELPRCEKKQVGEFRHANLASGSASHVLHDHEQTHDDRRALIKIRLLSINVYEQRKREFAYIIIQKARSINIVDHRKIIR